MKGRLDLLGVELSSLVLVRKSESGPRHLNTSEPGEVALLAERELAVGVVARFHLVSLVDPSCQLLHRFSFILVLCRLTYLQDDVVKSGPSRRVQLEQALHQQVSMVHWVASSHSVQSRENRACSALRDSREARERKRRIPTVHVDGDRSPSYSAVEL